MEDVVWLLRVVETLSVWLTVKRGWWWRSTKFLARFAPSILEVNNNIAVKGRLFDLHAQRKRRLKNIYIFFYILFKSVWGRTLSLRKHLIFIWGRKDKKIQNLNFTKLIITRKRLAASGNFADKAHFNSRFHIAVVSSDCSCSSLIVAGYVWINLSIHILM